MALPVSRRRLICCLTLVILATASLLRLSRRVLQARDGGHPSLVQWHSSLHEDVVLPLSWDDGAGTPGAVDATLPVGGPDAGCLDEAAGLAVRDCYLLLPCLWWLGYALPVPPVLHVPGTCE